jgi:hypothetical protein
VDSICKVLGWLERSVCNLDRNEFAIGAARLSTFDWFTTNQCSDSGNTPFDHRHEILNYREKLFHVVDDDESAESRKGYDGGGSPLSLSTCDK